MQGRLPNPPALWLRRACVIVAGLVLLLLGGGRALAADAPTDAASDKRWIQVTPSVVLPVRVGELWGALRPDGSTLLSPVFSSLTLMNVSSTRGLVQSVGEGANSTLRWTDVEQALTGQSPPLVRPSVFIVAALSTPDRQSPQQNIVFTVDGRRLVEYAGAQRNWKWEWFGATEILDRRSAARPPFDPWLPDPVAGDGPVARVHLLPGAAYAGVEVMQVPPPKGLAAPPAPAPAPAVERPSMVSAYTPLDQATRIKWQEQVGRERKIPDLATYGFVALEPGDDSSPYLFLMAKPGRPFLLAHLAAKKLKQVAREPFQGQRGTANGDQGVTYLMGSAKRQVRLACSAGYFAIAVDQHVALYSEACELLAEADVPPFDAMRFTRDGQCLYISTVQENQQAQGQLLTMQGTLHEPRVSTPLAKGSRSAKNLDDLYGPAYIAQSDKGVGLYRPDLQRWVMEPRSKEIYRTANRQFFRVLDDDYRVRIVNERGTLELLSERSCADYLPPGVLGPAALVVHFKRLGDFTPTLAIGDGEPVADRWTTGRIMAYTNRYLAFEVDRSADDYEDYAYRLYDLVRGEWLPFEPKLVCRVSPEILYVAPPVPEPPVYLMSDGSHVFARRPAPKP